MGTPRSKLTYSHTTRGVQVEVVPSYLGLSLPQFPGKHLFSYEITITNTGDVSIQLLRRHWIITDGQGNVEEVRGDGVIGEQPTITPGDSHQYSSFCPLATEIGTMRGSYQMVTQEGEMFDAEIPLFPLVTPSAKN